MGTTRIKVIDLSGEKEQIKTSRKHAEKLSGVAALKEEKKPKKAVDKETKVIAESSIPSEPSAPSPPPTKPATTKLAPPPIRHRHLGRKYLEAKSLIEPGKPYPAREAIELLYKTSITKFDPTVEIHLNVADKNLRGNLNLPHPIAAKKPKKILVFAEAPAGNKGKKLEDAKNIIWGNEKTIEEIAAGKLKPNRDFEMVLSMPKFMPNLGKIAKILGPANLMPSPKNGTIIENLDQVLKRQEDESIEYKTDPNIPIIHSKLGKLSFQPDQLEQNLKALVATVGPTKIKKATITTTMGPPIKIDITSVIAAQRG